MIVDKKKIIKVDVFSFSKGLVVSSDDFNVSEAEQNGALTIIIKGQNIISVSKNTPVEVVFYYINGDRVKYDTQVDVCTDFQINVTIGVQSTLLEERRRFYKLETDLNASIILTIKDNEEMVFERPILSKIKNLNIGGVFLECKSKFKIADIIAIKFKVLEEELNLAVKILRIQNRENGTKGYGCSFVGLITREEEILARYINSIQRNQLDSIKKKINSR